MTDTLLYCKLSIDIPFHTISHFEPDFTGEKSKLYVLQQCIIYLKYLVV